MMKHAIITGGSSGIGKAVAQQLLEQGWSVSLMARTESTLSFAKAELEKSLSSASQAINLYSVDVSNVNEIGQAIDQSINASGIADMLMTSAGIAVPGYFDDIDLDTHRQTMSINYFGTLYAIKAVIPYMKERKKGNIVLVSSGAGLVGLFGYTPYSPSKFALRGLAESMRKELKDCGITTSIVYPPDTDTPQLIAEQKTKPRETTRITENAKMWSAEAVATCILKGVRKGHFVITPGWEMSLLSVLHSLINPILQWQFDSIVDKVRKNR